MTKKRRWKHLLVAVIDTETSGVNPYKHELCEFAAVVGREEVERKTSFLLRTHNPHDAGAVKATGITKAMTDADGLRPKQGTKAIVSALDDVGVVIAHNATFDRRFIHKYMTNHNHPAWNPNRWLWIDTVVWMRKKITDREQTVSLRASMEHLGAKAPKSGDFHRAMYDARCLWRLWRRLRDDLPDDVDAVLEEQRAKGSIHSDWVDKEYGLVDDRTHVEYDAKGVLRFSFGGRKGESVVDVLREKPNPRFQTGYVEWVLGNVDLKPEEREAILTEAEALGVKGWRGRYSGNGDNR